MKNKQMLTIQKRSRKAVLEMLKQKQEVWRDFQMFPNEYQEELLLFCMGEKVSAQHMTKFSSIFIILKNIGNGWKI